jgi:hypothetical protein
MRHNPTSYSAPIQGVNRTLHPLLAPFVISFNISVAISYLCFQKDTWKLFRRIQFLKKRRRKKEKRVRKKNKERIKG